MDKRTVLRAAACAGLVAIAAQAIGYRFLSLQDEQGTSQRHFATRIGEARLRIRYPNTWKVNVQSRRPEFRLLLRGPQKSQIQILASTALLSLAQAQEARKKDPLPAVHAALEGIASSGLTHYSEEPAQTSRALQTVSLVSFVQASRNGQRLRGFRYTLISGDRVWSVIALTPEKQWRKSLPLLRNLVTSLRLD
ncbi:MAG: hypothetical protein IT209_10445 [Armatimonadetes bacterium]|nr:hypothetical protein [Armatimonadota bacterium]